MSPLYPGLLSLVFRIFGVYSLTSAFVILTINSVLSTLTCIPVYFSAKYSLGLRAAKVSAWAWALYPFAIYFSAGRVWEYSLTSLLFTTCFCIAQRIHQSAKPLAWIGFGALYGITAHSNASVMSTLPFLLGFALWQAHKAGKRWVLNGALTLITFFAVLTPWTIRNYRALGVIVPIRDNIWLELMPTTSATRPTITLLRPRAATGGIQPTARRSCRNISPWARFPISRKKRPCPSTTSGIILTIRSWSSRLCAASSITGPAIGVFLPEELQTQPFTPEMSSTSPASRCFMLLGIRSLWRTNRTAVMPYLLIIRIFPSPTTSRIP